MQLDFNFGNNNQYYLDDFIVFKGNQEAFNFVNGKLDSYKNSRVFLINGAEKSGKTYLCHIWREKAGAVFLDFNKINKIKDIKKYHIALMDFIKPNGNYILEDLDNLNLEEEKLFHLINIVNEKGARLLITSEKPVNDFFFEINDLQSRFNNIINFKIKVLDNKTKELYIIKLFADKQLNIDEKVVDFLVKNTSCVYKDIYDKVDRIIRIFLQEKRKKINVKFIKNLVF